MYLDWFKGNNGELILTDGPLGIQWKQYPEERDDRSNPLYFTCRFCRKTTGLYQQLDHPRYHEPLHEPGCQHPHNLRLKERREAAEREYSAREEIKRAMLSLQV